MKIKPHASINNKILIIPTPSLASAQINAKISNKVSILVFPPDLFGKQLYLKCSYLKWVLPKFNKKIIMFFMSNLLV